MTTLTIKLSGERMLRLREAAARYGVTPEELARVGIEDLLLQPLGAHVILLTFLGLEAFSAGVVRVLLAAHVGADPDHA